MQLPEKRCGGEKKQGRSGSTYGHQHEVNLPLRKGHGAIKIEGMLLAIGCTQIGKYWKQLQWKWAVWDGPK